MFFEFPWKLEHTSQVTSTQWLIISLVGFLLILWVFLKFVWPSMIRPHLVDRQKGIIDAARQVESTLTETKALRDDYQRRLEEIHSETQRRMEEAVHEAESLRDTILAEASENVAALARRSESEIERERAKMHVRLRREFVSGVIAATQYAASRSLNESHQRKLVASFVKDLESGEAAASTTPESRV